MYVATVKYPNRMDGVIEFSPTEEESENSGMPTKNESMKDILQQIKETIVRTAFC